MDYKVYWLAGVVVDGTFELREGSIKDSDKSMTPQKNKRIKEKIAKGIRQELSIVKPTILQRLLGRMSSKTATVKVVSIKISRRKFK